MACPDVFNNNAIFDVVVFGTYDSSDEVVNSYQMRLVSGGGAASMSDIAESLKDSFETLYAVVKTVCNVIVTFEGVRVATLDSNCVSGDYLFDTAQQGTLTGNALPPGTTFLTTFPTGIKRVILKKFISGLDDSQLTATGTLLSSPRATLNTVWDTLMADVSANGLRWEFGYKSPKTGTWLKPTTKNTGARVGYQRRRKRGVGS